MATFTCWLVRSNVLWQRLFFKRRTVFAHHTASTEEKRECHPVNLFWTRQMKTGVRNPVEQRLIHDISGLASWPSTLCSGLMAPYMFIENLSPSNIFDVVKNSAFRSRSRTRKENKKERNCCLCTCKLHTCISNVDHFESRLRSSDRIWQVKDGNCAFLFWLGLISTTFLPPYLPLMRSLVSDSELQRAFW